MSTYPKIIRVLTECVSPDTAFVQDDYPYGRELRCQRRNWLEFKKRHGYRHVTQTSDARRGNVTWNKPHGSTYNWLEVLCLTDEFKQADGVTPGGVEGFVARMDLDDIDAWVACFAADLTPSQRINAATIQQVIARQGGTRKGRVYTVTDADSGEVLTPDGPIGAGHALFGALRIVSDETARRYLGPAVYVPSSVYYTDDRHPLTILDDRRTGRRLKIAYAGQAAGTAAA